MTTQHHTTLNENTVRLVAFFVAMLTVIFLVTGNIIPIVILVIDFATRGLGFKQYSLLRIAGDAVNNMVFGGSKKPIFAPPKLFAARIGLLFSVAIAVFYLTGFTFTSYVLAGVLTFFALLESVVNICVACYMYSFMHRTGVLKS